MHAQLSRDCDLNCVELRVRVSRTAAGIVQNCATIILLNPFIEGLR